MNLKILLNKMKVAICIQYNQMHIKTILMKKIIKNHSFKNIKLCSKEKMQSMKERVKRVMKRIKVK